MPTHAVLSNPLWNALKESPIEELILLDTVPLPPEKNAADVYDPSGCAAFAEAIERVYEDKPVSPMFV